MRLLRMFYVDPADHGGVLREDVDQPLLREPHQGVADRCRTHPELGCQRGARQWRLEDRPDAIFAANDLLAMGVLQALMLHRRVRVPEDIALIGYDDIAFASAAVVPLSSVRQPSELIGYRAVDLLIREAEAGVGFLNEHVEFQPELVVRASTAGSQ